MSAQRLRDAAFKIREAEAEPDNSMWNYRTATAVAAWLDYEACVREEADRTGMHVVSSRTVYSDTVADLILGGA